MAVREKYVLICRNMRAEDDPKGIGCGGRCPELTERFKLRLREKGLHARFRSLGTSCMDFCATGPTVAVMPDNVWYRGVRLGDVDAIIDEHLLGGRPVDRLRHEAG